VLATHLQMSVYRKIKRQDLRQRRITVIQETSSAYVLRANPATTNNSAESAEEYRVTVTVPFPFVVAGRALPAGAYVISARRRNPESVSLWNWENSVLLQVKGWALKWFPEGSDTIVFNKFRGVYLLTDIHFAQSLINIHFPAITAQTWNLTGSVRSSALRASSRSSVAA
jgi:drug/metabolite transporter superfamily protein YnfA